MGNRKVRTTACTLPDGKGEKPFSPPLPSMVLRHIMPELPNHFLYLRLPEQGSSFWQETEPLACLLPVGVLEGAIIQKVGKAFSDILPSLLLLLWLGPLLNLGCLL